MSEENEKRVAAMTVEEREQERREIEEKFGKNIGDVLRRARMAREAHEKQAVPPGSYILTLVFADLTFRKQCAPH